jgi:predicted RNase H-like nuclease (RuvC/YqgF family)
LAAAQAQAICRDLQAELEAEHESAEAARHEASETAHKYFALRDKYEQREALVNHQKETISALKRDNERSGGEIDELKARCKELKLCLRDNEMTYLNRQDLTEEVEHLNRIIADANVRDRERAIELQR